MTAKAFWKSWLGCELYGFCFVPKKDDDDSYADVEEFQTVIAESSVKDNPSGKYQHNIISSLFMLIF